MFSIPTSKVGQVFPMQKAKIRYFHCLCLKVRQDVLPVPTFTALLFDANYQTETYLKHNICIK